MMPSHNFEAMPPPPAPDYATDAAWAAMPTRADDADVEPEGTALPEAQADAPVDVFFLHPTTYYSGDQWNGPIDDPDAKLFTDRGVLRAQASAFNAAGKVYAPYYRQVTLAGLRGTIDDNRQQALELAYADVKRAFEQFVQHRNAGRPFILASHSQGTMHAVRLLEERIGGSADADRLIAAYLIGATIPRGVPIGGLEPCASATDTGCFVAWNSYSGDFDLDTIAQYSGVLWRDGGYVRGDQHASVQVNPLTWELGGGAVPAEENPGALQMRSYESDELRLLPAVTGADASGAVLRVSRPEVRGFSMLTGTGWFHIYDYHLFYESIRHNAAERSRTFLARQAAAAN